MVDYKMVDGIKMPLTAEEQADHDARIAAWPETYAAQITAQNLALAANPVTQIANLIAALIAANVITTDALPTAQITAVNNTLSAIGAATISTTATLAATKIS